MRILLKIIVNAIALWASTLLPGVSLGNGPVLHRVLSVLAVAVIFGVINAVLKPIIKTVGCGLYILTLGLFSLVVNAVLFWLTGWLAGKLHLDFYVHGFWNYVFGAIIISVVAFLLHIVIPDRRGNDE